MKTINRNAVIVVTLFLLLWTVLSASAFYAPNVQRWVNRDPMGDKRQQLYSFVANRTPNFVDPLGHWYASGKSHTGTSLSIVCDGKGGIRIYYPPGYVRGHDCLANCMDVHENCHKTKALNENPDMCKGQKDGTAIQTNDPSEKSRDEVMCSEEQLECIDNCKGKCPDDFVNSERKRIKDYQDTHKKRYRQHILGD